jgi:hypothetical protein
LWEADWRYKKWKKDKYQVNKKNTNLENEVFETSTISLFFKYFTDNSDNIENSDTNKNSLLSSDDEESTIEWEVEYIVDKKYSETGTEYLIKWINSEISTWEPKEHMTGCKEALNDFRNRKPALVMVKDMQKQLPLPKLSPQPSDYYRKVIVILFFGPCRCNRGQFNNFKENCMFITWDFMFAMTPK